MRGLLAAGFVLASMLVDATAIAPKGRTSSLLTDTGILSIN
jgi:hypothetical protein